MKKSVSTYTHYTHTHSFELLNYIPVEFRLISRTCIVSCLCHLSPVLLSPSVLSSGRTLHRHSPMLRELLGKATLSPFQAPGVPNGMLRMLRLMLPFAPQATSLSQHSTSSSSSSSFLFLLRSSCSGALSFIFTSYCISIFL